MNYEEEGKLAQIRDERGYSYMDIITVSPDKLPNYEQKVHHVTRVHINVLLYAFIISTQLITSHYLVRLSHSLKNTFIVMRKSGLYLRGVATLMCVIKMIVGFD